MSNLRAAVFAYSEVGHTCLKELLRQGTTVQAVFTHEDNPAETLWFPSVAALAREAGIPVFTPDSLGDEEYAMLLSLRPDVIFSFYYRSMIPERFLAIAESFEVCTLYPLLGIGCRLVPAVVEGDYLSSTGRGTLDYASAETPGVPPEPLTYDGSFVEVPAQPSDGFNAVLDEVFAHALTDSAFPGVEPGEVVLPPEGVLVPEAPAAPPTGEVPR